MKVFQIEDLPIESRMLTDALTEAQRKVEAYFFGEAPFASAAAKARYSSMQRLEAALWQLWLCLLCLLCSRIEMSNRSQKQRMCYGYLILGTRKEGSEVGAPCADIRKQLWEYDQVLNTQRDKVYLDRRRALASRDLSPLLVEYAERTVDDILEARRCP